MLFTQRYRDRVNGNTLVNQDYLLTMLMSLCMRDMYDAGLRVVYIDLLVAVHNTVLFHSISQSCITVVLPSFGPCVCFRVVGVWCNIAMAGA